MRQLFLLIMLVQLCGCASMHLLQFEDAETEPAGGARGGWFAGAGPNFYSLYHDSLRTPGAISFMMGASGKIGLFERLDVGAAAWTNSLPPFGLLIAGLLDAGGRLDAKLMLTPRSWEHRLALVGSAGGYWSASTRVDYGDAGYGSTFSLGPGLIYSWQFRSDSSGRRASLYLAARTDRFSSSYVYDTGDSLRRSRDESIHVEGVQQGYTVALGMRARGADLDGSAGAVELAATFVPNPWTGVTDWVLFGGVAFTFSALLP